jgi:hypothetical protein
LLDIAVDDRGELALRTGPRGGATGQSRRATLGLRSIVVYLRRGEERADRAPVYGRHGGPASSSSRPA